MKFTSFWQPQRSQTFSLQLSKILSGEMKLKKFMREKSVEKIELESLKLAENDLELRALEI